MSTQPPALLETCLHARHLALGARMVPFGGWHMPIDYGSIVAEHRAVRTAAGMFDVSHMGRLWFAGAPAGDLLQQVLTCDVPQLAPGRARYTLACTETGGILDDTILYCLEPGRWLLVCNASNRPAVLACLREQLPAGQPEPWDDRTEATGMIALQGPGAAAVLADLGAPEVADATPYFGLAYADLLGSRVLWARTGYTGEDGFELIAQATVVQSLWDALAERGVAPCGLGARDTLRLEAGLPLHGQDITTQTNPVEAGLGWAVAWGKAGFVGEAAVRRARAEGVAKRLVGLQLEGRAIPRSHQPVLHEGAAVGEVTSGSFSPTLGRGIALAYVDTRVAKAGTSVAVDVRGAPAVGQVVRLPFYRGSVRPHTAA